MPPGWTRRRFGSWYRDIGGGMGAALNAAAAMDAYTLSDRGTWLSFNNKGDLAIAGRGRQGAAEPLQRDRPKPGRTSPEGRAPAKRLAAWLLSAEGQKAIGRLQLAGQALFHPERISCRSD